MTGILHDERRALMLKEGFEVAFIRVGRDESWRILSVGYRYVGPPARAAALGSQPPPPSAGDYSRAT
jgi:hypothetical protein